jgi:spermidine synthase
MDEIPHVSAIAGSDSSMRAPRTEAGIRAGVYVVFTISGSTALIYQILWGRWLSLTFGNTTASVSVVLGSFMLGLALGSWLVGRLLSRIENPLAAYAWLELGIGAFAVAFPWLTQLVVSILTAVVSDDSSQTVSIAVRAVLAFALLAVPTTFMGATLPLLTDFFRRSPRHTRAWKVGLLYAANTFGAALGSVAASFVLIELIGVRSTTLLAASGNAIVAGWALLSSRSISLIPLPPVRAASPRLDLMGRLALAVLAASGATALASEVLWTRTLEIVVGSSSYAFALILVVYLVGLAAGSASMSLAVNRLARLPLWLAATQVAMGLWIVVAIATFERLSNRLAQYGWVSLSVPMLLANYGRAAVVLIPLALISGAVFPIATRMMDPRSEDAAGTLIARAYSWNTLGAVAGSLIAGFVIAPRLAYFEALFFLAFLYAVTALAVLAVTIRWGALGGTRRLAAGLASLALALEFLGFTGIRGVGPISGRWRPKTAEVLYQEPGIQGVTSVVRKNRQTNLVVNGTSMTGRVTETKVMAHLPLLMHPAPEDVLVVGFGMGTTYRAAISHGVRVTVVELVPEVYRAFGYFFQDANRARTYPKGRVIFNDGRNFLELTRTHFDVITIDPPPPIDAAGVNNLYSKEFYELARDHLKPGGLMAQWIPLSGTKLGVDDLPTFRMLLRTFQEVFPDTRWLLSISGLGVHLLGSMTPIDVSADRLERRLAGEGVAADLNEWEHVPPQYFKHLARLVASELKEASLDTDDRPRLEFGLIRAWRVGSQKTYPPIW